jgi:hypothetical protein
MLYRDFMQKFRPLYAPDGADGGAPNGAATAADAGTTAAAAAPTAGAQDAAPAAAAPAVPDAAPAAEPSVPDSAPSLLEAATGKPKPDGDAVAAKPEAGADVKKDEPAPAEAAKPDAAKPEGDKPKDDAAKDKDAKTDPDAKDATAAEPPAPIKYEAFKLPDGLKLDDKELGKFSEFAGKAQIPQDVAQGLIDMYVAERQQDVVNARAEQRKVWDTLNDTWKTELRNDPELGGNRLETSLSLAKAVVEEYLSPAEQAEYMAHMRNNGMGNYKLHIKLLHNIGKAMNVFEDGIVPANAQAPKASKGPGQRGWYDKSLNAPQ